MAKRLFDVWVGEVSMVDKAANKKRFYLAKASAATPEKPVYTQEVSKAMADDLKTSPAAVDLPKVPEPVVFLKADGEADPSGLAKLDPIARTQIEALMKSAADAKAKAVELEKRLAAEQDAKELAEEVTKCAKAFKSVPATAAELAADLRSVRKSAGKEVAQRLEDVLAKCEALIQKAIEPLGRATDPAKEGQSAWEQISKRANELVTKGEVKSFAAGVSKVLADDKTLYAAHVAEKDQ